VFYLTIAGYDYAKLSYLLELEAMAKHYMTTGFVHLISGMKTANPIVHLGAMNGTSKAYTKDTEGMEDQNNKRHLDIDTTPIDPSTLGT
jgi:hypothetical protein